MNKEISMNWWVIKQLRAFVMADLSGFIQPIEFEQAPASLKLSPQIPNHNHFSQELRWGHAAATLGKKLFFTPPHGMTARQISASDVMMNMGLLASAEAMHRVLTQVCNDAAKAHVSAGNAGDIQKQLEREHIPVFLDNLRGALSQYFHYLTEQEKAPFASLLEQKISVSHFEPKNNILPPIDIATHHFDVALSFPGETRQFVEEVVAELKMRLGDNSYFYDNNYVSQLARPSLDTLLQDIYRNRAKVVVVFLSDDYEHKKWCGIEFRAIREIISDQEDKVMFVRTGEGTVSGVFKTDGYVDAKRFGPAEIAKFIQERVLLAKMPKS
jgi:hypothetical protein